MISTRKTSLALALLAVLHGGAAWATSADAPAPAAVTPAAMTGAAESDGTKTLEAVSVIGQGESRQVQRITVQDVKLLPPGSSPLKVLAKLPGVHFESADSFGNYEWSTRISLRGFNQTRLGFTLDGIPLGDMSYGNNNGLHISRALIAENLGGAELAAGIGALGTASTGNLGGTVQFYSADPSSTYGVTLAQSAGSDSALRTYARLDTGDHNGFAMYLSGAYADSDKWKGNGPQKQQQFNGKAVYDFGDNHVAAMLNTSSRNETDYQDLSLDMQKRLGWNWDNYAPDWQRAVNAAKGIFTGGVNNKDDAYYAGRGLRDDSLASLFGDFGLAEGVRLKATGYYHSNRGQGHWFTPYQTSFAGTPQETPIAIRTTEYGIDRWGTIASLGWDLGNHHLEGGFWYENSHHTVQRNFYFIAGPVDDQYFLHNPSIRKFYQRYETETHQLYLQDTISLLDGRLHLDVGVKSPQTRTRTHAVVGSYANGELTADKSLLPQLGASYKLDGQNELFASYAQNIAAFQAGISGPFATTQAAFDVIRGKLRPEESRTVEAGVRHAEELFEGSLALYDVKFDHRLLAIQQCSSGIQGCPSAYANVGSVTSRGAELTFILKPTSELRWYNALSYNRSRYDSDYLNGATVVATRGKTVVDSPKQLFSSEIAWTPGAWDLRLSANYTGKRYYTYVNDASVPSYWLFNAAAAYDFGKLGVAEDLKLALNVTNLAGKHYYGTIGSNGFTAADPTGEYATLQVGAPRAAMLTATVRF
ncbi:TonB-dependent receptor [Rhodanobacter thiooxydans LCS2]|nr:TonB-dependent receptor [Rhodanobacter thiooxydans LCS2]